MQTLRVVFGSAEGRKQEKDCGMHATHDLVEGQIKAAQAGLRCRPAARIITAPMLLFMLQGLMRMPYRVCQRAVLRNEQQHDANELHQVAL